MLGLALAGWGASSVLALTGGINGDVADGRANGAGSTRVATWKDDRTAVFLLMFDDGYASHFQVVIPELQKRDMIATFYINPGKAEYKQMAGQWNEKIPPTGMVYGDHTMTHGGVKDLENADWEIGECARIIRTLQPGKENRLVSYGQPGVGPGKWNITGAQLKEVLARHNLVSRPTFDGHGAVYHLKTLEQMVELADKAIQTKGVEYLVTHGVQRITPDWGWQDMWPLRQDVFFPLLDALKERRDRGDLWITDHISAHQYETERKTAGVKVLKVIAAGIQLELKSQADPALYDLPLTLVTQVPPTWTRCNISQGARQSTATAVNGVVKFDAVPNAEPIILRPATP